MDSITKKQKGLIIGFALVLLVSVVGITYAYFTASNNINTTNNVSVSTIELSDLTINVLAPQGDTTNIYPGWVGYQVVTVEGDNGTGIGKYSLTIQSSNYATELGSDVTYTIYRSNSSTLSPLPVANSFTGEYASGTLQTESVGNEFRYSIEGASFTVPNSYTLVSENNLLSSAKNSAITFVNNRDYTGSTKEAYIIVYRYNNNGNQNTEQGKGFTAVINGSQGLVGPQISVAVSNGVLMNIENKSIEETIEPSSSVSRNITLSNPTNSTQKVDVVLEGVTNTYTDLTADLTKGNTVIVEDKEIPVVTNEDVVIKRGLEVSSNSNDEYTITINNNNTNTEPTANLEATLNIAESTAPLSCTVYCTSPSNCSKQEPEIVTEGVRLYSKHTCTNGKTNAIEACYASSSYSNSVTKCEGGEGYVGGVNYPCIASTSDYRISATAYCPGVGYTGVITGIAMSGDNYDCSCN